MPRIQATPPGEVPWDWTQHFSVRACTVMLLYVIVLLAFGLLDTHLDTLPEPLLTVVQLCGWSCWRPRC